MRFKELEVHVVWNSLFDWGSRSKVLEFGESGAVLQILVGGVHGGCISRPYVPCGPRSQRLRGQETRIRD